MRLECHFVVAALASCRGSLHGAALATPGGDGGGVRPGSFDGVLHFLPEMLLCLKFGGPFRLERSVERQIPR